MPALTGTLLSAGMRLPRDRVRSGRGRRCAARPDEDAVTLAAEAGMEAMAGCSEQPVSVILASTTPPYEEGGNVQPIAEMLGLRPDTFTVELSATARDGLAAVRLAAALIAAGAGPVLVCASHIARPEGDGEAGDGAVALLMGTAPGLAELMPGPIHVEELRDRWRLPGHLVPREGDESFVRDFGVVRPARLLAASAATPERSTLVAGTSGRSGARAERTLGGPGDPLIERTGFIGCAHSLLRLLTALDTVTTVIAVAGGLADAVSVDPSPEATKLAERAREAAQGGDDIEEPMPMPAARDFDPYASGPRAWRERGQDLRLEGHRYGDRLCFPPPAAPPPGHEGEAVEVEPLARSGRVLTFTRDHVYPGGDETGMAVVDLDDGIRFFGQVTSGDAVNVGDEVRLVPRRLHAGGGIVQYFWKVSPCR